MAAREVSPTLGGPVASPTPMEVSQGEQQGRVVSIRPKPQRTDCVKYDIPVDERIKDLYNLGSADYLIIAQGLKEAYSDREQESPAAGYKVEVKLLSKGKRTVEVTLWAIGTREKGTPLEMPAMPKTIEACDMCKKAMDAMAKTDKACRIWSLEGNPLTISSDHYSHTLDMPAPGIADMIEEAAEPVHSNNPDCSRYTLSSHIGKKGGQTFGHAHFHSEGAYTDPSKKEAPKA